jgi:glycosyltransferase involved in cell wall biosynthesis
MDFRFVSWLDNDAAILLMRHATVLLFPSAWQEPLSRVLLEGLAAGAAIVALDTGGTSDAIAHAESGWLAKDAAEFTEGIRLVSSNTQLNATLRSGARRRAEEVFAAPNVSARVEALYTRLLEGLGA